MLADGDGEALDCALAAQELLERALGAQEAGALLREVGNFDFDAALIRVRSLGARLAPAAHRLITGSAVRIRDGRLVAEERRRRR